jgi:hypothetical protein
MSKPEIDMRIISSALADFLTARFPAATVYDNPNQQNTVIPAWFINYMPDASITKQIDGRYNRKFNIDLVFLEDYNLPGLYDIYRNAAEVLDESLELFSFEQNGETYWLRTYERNWTADLSALHYKFRLEMRVSQYSDSVKMQEIQELSEDVAEKE